MKLNTKRLILNFGERTLPEYKRLSEELTGSPSGLSNREQFLIAMSWGFRNGARVKEFKRSGNGARLDFLKDEDIAIMAAIQLMTTNDPDSLRDVDQMLDIAEQYAEGGIRLLAEKMDEPGVFPESFAAEIRKHCESLPGS